MIWKPRSGLIGVGAEIRRLCDFRGIGGGWKMRANGTGDKDKGRDYDLVPPEGGWGFIVCVGLSVSFIAATAHLPCLGFIYRDFLEDLGEGTSALATVQGVFSFMTAVAGFLANIALKRFSLRTVGVCGAFISTLGAFFGIFVQTTLHLIMAMGVLQGLGLGVMIPVLYTSYNSYFTIKKVLYLSLCKAAIGLFIMLYPLFLKLTMDFYGFRGTLAIICAIAAHSIPGNMVMQPVSWHMIKRPKNCELIVVIPPTPAVANGEAKDVFDFQRPSNGDAKNGISKSAENLQPLIASPITEEKFHMKTPTFLSPFTDARRSSTPTISLGLGNRRRSSTLRAVPDESFGSNDAVYMQNVIRAASMSSLGNFGMEPLPPVKNKQGKWQTLADFFDLSLLKDPLYSNLAIGMSLSFFADLMFFALEPLLLDHYKFDKSEVTSIISVGGATDMAGKLALGLAAQFFQVNSRYVFYVGSILPAIIRTIFLQFSAYMPVLVLTGVLGLLRSMLHITMPLVMASYIPIERYPAAWGLLMLIFGIVNITVGPLIGIVRDKTGSYALAFHLLSACNLACVLPWTVEAIISMCRKKKASKT